MNSATRVAVAPARAKSHPSRDDFLEDREGAPEAATFIRLRRGAELNAGDFREQIHRLGEDLLTQLGGCRMLELAQQLLCSPTRCGKLAHGAGH
jgi:hypothetical protein